MEALTQGLFLKDIVALLVTNILAFILLLLILRKFAWGPILKMLDDRRDKVQGDYATAKAKVDEAEGLRQGFEDKLDDIKGLERERVQEAVKRGESIAASLERAARDKAEDIREKGHADLDRDVATARLELRETVVSMTITAAEKLVKEKLDDAKHRQLIEDFISGLGDSRA